MARGQGEKPVRGATGDVRDVTSNVQGTKHDKGMPKGLNATTNRTGSPAGDKVIEERAKEEK